MIIRNKDYCLLAAAISMVTLSTPTQIRSQPKKTLLFLIFALVLLTSLPAEAWKHAGALAGGAVSGDGLGTAYGGSTTRKSRKYEAGLTDYGDSTTRKYGAGWGSNHKPPKFPNGIKSFVRY